VKIEEAKRELDIIEAELTRKVDMMELWLEPNKHPFPNKVKKKKKLWL
jgi:hypothetical protein